MRAFVERRCGDRASGRRDRAVVVAESPGCFDDEFTRTRSRRIGGEAVRLEPSGVLVGE